MGEKCNIDKKTIDRWEERDGKKGSSGFMCSLGGDSRKSKDMFVINVGKPKDKRPQQDPWDAKGTVKHQGVSKINAGILQILRSCL